MINPIIIFFIGAWVGADLAYRFLYSPKAMIKRHWKEISKLTTLGANPLEESITKRKRMINALFDYLDPEKDKKFIEQHKP